MTTQRHEISDEDEAQIQRAIVSDPDATEATDDQLARALPFAQALPELMDSIRRARGRPRTGNPKLKVTIRLDADVLERLRASGPGWQGRINERLRKDLGIG